MRKFPGDVSKTKPIKTRLIQYWFPGNGRLRSGVIQEETYNFIISGVLLKHRSTNFTLVEATFASKERMYISNVTAKGFFYLYVSTSVRLLS